MKFCKFFENLRKSLTIFCCDFRFRAVQKCDNLVDLGKCCKMSIYLQNFMPIQPRTSLLKFGHLAVKSGKGTVLYLSTKAAVEPEALGPLRGHPHGLRLPLVDREEPRLQQHLCPLCRDLRLIGRRTSKGAPIIAAQR